EGLVLRIDGKAEWQEVLQELEQFLGGRKKFFEGGEVSIEWLERLPTKEQSGHLETLLREEYGMEIISRRKRLAREARRDDVLEGESEDKERQRSGVTIPLFDEVKEHNDIFALTGPESPRASLQDQVERFTSETLGDLYTGAGSSSSSSGEGRESPEQLRRRYINRVARLLGDEVYYEDEANAKVVYGTLRSGQRVETPFSLIVVGDVNPGADLAAGGDIIVLGSLRGTAHASAYDDDSFDRVIIALQMQPMQLRIGSVISRGSEDVVQGAEIARIENRRIIVEPFSPRKLFGRKLR
ncbi:MAG: hypothetical protein KDD69_19525, partial [Bdellovibrionales bacterium]|nr:hypothetical protein [Bdellovibrionales bacterium]